MTEGGRWRGKGGGKRGEGREREGGEGREGEERGGGKGGKKWEEEEEGERGERMVGLDMGKSSELKKRRIASKLLQWQTRCKQTRIDSNNPPTALL